MQTKITFLFLALLLCFSLRATTWYVRPSGSDLNAGISWSQAFRSLQKALEISAGGDEIWVAGGTYDPSKDVAGNASPSDLRTRTFQINKVLKIYGGFPASGTPGFEERDWEAYPTYLDGEIGDNTTSADNCYRVVTIYNAGSGVIMDGITVYRGNANDPNSVYDDAGGVGIFNSGVSFSNCSFVANKASIFGGGIGFNESNVQFSHCTFIQNAARYGAGLSGSNSDIILSDCTFQSNNAFSNGGGVYIYNSSGPPNHTSITNCRFIQNFSGQNGTVVFEDNIVNLDNCHFRDNIIGESHGFGFVGVDADLQVTNSTFNENMVTSSIYFNSESQAKLKMANCTFNHGGSGGILNVSNGTVEVKNCILWTDDTLPVIENYSNADIQVTHSIVKGGYPGEGNLDANPLFTDAASGNLHLQDCSPAIDAGDATDAPAEDTEGKLRPFPGTAVDMGAFEFQEIKPVPSAFCMDVTVQLDADGTAGFPAAQLDNGSTGCEPLAFSVEGLADLSFDCDDIGSNTVPLTVTGNNGASVTCNAVVTVKDEIAPVFSCEDLFLQRDQSLDAPLHHLNGDTGLGQQFTAGLTGSLKKVRLNFSQSQNQPVEIFIRQGSGKNGAIISSSETLLSPGMSTSWKTITFSAPAQVIAGNKYTIWIVENLENAPGSVNVGSPSSAYLPHPGSKLYFFDGTEIGGASMLFETFVQPTLVYPSDPGQCGATIDLPAAEASDNCSFNITSIPASGSFFQVGTTQLTLTATDLSTNSTACTTSITIEDQEMPVAVCRNITGQLDAEGAAQIQVSDIDDGSSDNCSVQSMVLDQLSFSCEDAGANSVTLTVTDVHGNISSCQATVTLEDNIAPTALCQDATIQLDAVGTAQLQAGDIDNGSSDNCAVQSMAIDQPSFGCEDVGANTVTLTVSDVNGNTSTCQATVTIEDNIAPTALCRDVTIQLDAAGAAQVQTGDIDDGSTDNCSVQSAVLSRQSFSCGDVGGNSVTLTITDVNGNEAACQGTVTVEDNIAPTAVCNDLTVQFNGEASIPVLVETIAQGADNCAVEALEPDISELSCADLGQVVQVTVTVTDPSGNSATCKSDITVTGLPCGMAAEPDGIACADGNDTSYDTGTGTFAITAGGCYTPGATADESGYIHYDLCGDGSITAHVAGLTLPGYAGIVMREDGSPGAKKVALVYQGANALQRFVRYTTGGASYPSYINTAGSRWLRLVRTGNIFKGYHSANGTFWSLAFTVTIPMNACIQIGLTASGPNGNSLVTATFDNVVIDPPYSAELPRNLVPVDFAANEAPQVELWPNPTSGIFSLVAENPQAGTGVLTLEILDGTGRQILNRQVHAGARTEIDLSGRAPGLYLVRLTGENGTTQFSRLILN